MAATRVAVLVSAVLCSILAGGMVIIGCSKPGAARAQDVASAPATPDRKEFPVSDELYDSDRVQPVASYEQLASERAGAGFTLASNGSLWRLDFSVSGRDDGAATRAVCHVRVEGTMSRGGRIEGVIVDGQSRWSGGTPPSGLREVVELTPGGARVVEDNIAELCDVSVKGRYRLIDPARR